MTIFFRAPLKTCLFVRLLRCQKFLNPHLHQVNSGLKISSALNPNKNPAFLEMPFNEIFYCSGRLFDFSCPDIYVGDKAALKNNQGFSPLNYTENGIKCAIFSSLFIGF